MRRIDTISVGQIPQQRRSAAGSQVHSQQQAVLAAGAGRGGISTARQQRRRGPAPMRRSLQARRLIAGVRMCTTYPCT
jgi:hypothetical protein